MCMNGKGRVVFTKEEKIFVKLERERERGGESEALHQLGVGV